jgi:hypothetical protein
MPVTAPFDETSKLAPLPQAMLDQFPGQWRLHGQGLFTWSVFRVYRAALHVQGESFNPSEPYALDLNYLRNVSADQIVQTSIQEMRRLHSCDEASLARWEEQLQAILPDVSLGDRLIGVFNANGVSFFSRDAALGQIDDAAFAEAFAAVWLDEQTRAPALRAKLLGLAS